MSFNPNFAINFMYYLRQTTESMSQFLTCTVGIVKKTLRVEAVLVRFEHIYL